MSDLSGGPLTLMGVFLTGLALNLTPCVYPLLSVTVSLFGGAKREVPRRTAFLKALTYVMGMSTMYSALGVAAAFTGGLFGGLLQSRSVLLGLSVFFALLALSMLGVYTFQLPGRLLQKLSGKKATNFLSLYLAGLLVGIFAAPCIGPPVIALLTLIGTQGDPLLAFQIFFMLSLGLGTPYLFLGTFSGFLNRLPKSGVWMVWVERLFGVILLVLAVFYACLAIESDFLKWLAPISLVLGGLYLGFIERSEKYSPSFLLFKKIIGGVAIALGIFLPFLSPKESVRWEPYRTEIISQAREAGQPVVLDFFADWCIPCHELDRFTYTDRRVIQALEGFRRLKVDMTDPNTDLADEVTERFQILGVPTILFLDPRGEEIPKSRITGFVSADEWLEHLNAFSSQLS